MAKLNIVCGNILDYLDNKDLIVNNSNENMLNYLNKNKKYNLNKISNNKNKGDKYENKKYYWKRNIRLTW